MAKTAVRKRKTTNNRSKAAKLHEVKTKERAVTLAELKAVYQTEKDKPVLVDLVAKCHQWISLHNKIAQDGVASKMVGKDLETGQAQYDVVYLTHEQRVSHSDKAAGIQEMLDYIERETGALKPIGE